MSLEHLPKDFDDYYQESDLILQGYSRNNILKFREELEFMDRWLLDDSHPVLLATGDPHSGKKTLLYSFLQEVRMNHPNWVLISHFVSMTPLCSNILYRLIVQLRSHFKVEQKVDLNEEKLRRYFKYWLEVVSDTLQKEFLGYKRAEIPKVMIVLQSVDLCQDSKGNIVEPQFWLPSQIPAHIKLLITSKDTGGFSFPETVILRHQMSKEQRMRIISSFSPAIAGLAGGKDLQLSHLAMLNEMVSQERQFEVKGGCFRQILGHYIKHCSDEQLTQKIINSLLYTLVLTRKGLKPSQIIKIVNISNSKWEQFLQKFRFCVVQFRDHFVIVSQAAREVIRALVDPSESKIRAYRHSIVKVLKKEVHLQNLEQMIYLLQSTQNYSQLKEVLARVENFIVLYTPQTKELLCQSWSLLQQIEQFDPVFEYNKAIETYTSHYYPNEEDLYKIIFQISMFFKEYAEFENVATPAFRHPLIKGETDSLISIGIYNELKDLSMIRKSKDYKLKPIQKNEQIRQKSEKLEQVQRNENRKVQKGVHDRQPTSRLKSQRQVSSTKSKERDEDTERADTERGLSGTTQGFSEVKFDIEEMNVGIGSNQEKFKHHFLNGMKQYLETYITPFKKGNHRERQLGFESQDSDNEEESCQEKNQKQLKFDLEKFKNSLVLKQFRIYLEESYHKTGEQMQFYYYKQWIWLQFPWLCQTIKHIYSQMLKQCLPGAIYYMSPLRELNLIRDAIRITSTAKLNKLGIFSDHKLEILPMKLRGEPDSLTLATSRKHTTSDSKVIQKNVNSQYRVNLGQIQLQIIKQKEVNARLKLKPTKQSELQRYQKSLPNLKLFVTQSEYKETRMLPSLQKNHNGAKQKGKENRQDSRDYTNIVRKFNQLKHDNEMLLEKIQELKRSQKRKGDKDKEELNNLNNSMVEKELKKAQVEKGLRNQAELRKKLDVIIKVCDLNKMHGSETDHLSYYLDNLKKMTDLEYAIIQKTKNQIYCHLDHAKNTLKELKRQKKDLRALKDQIVAYASIDTNSTNIQDLFLGKQTIDKQLRDMSKSMKKGKKTKVKERNFASSQDYQNIQNKLGIAFESGDNEEKIEAFVDKWTKLKELRIATNNFQEQCQIVTKEIESINSATDGNNSRDCQRQIRLAKDLVEGRKELTELKDRRMLLAHAMSAVQSQSQQ